MSRTPSIPLSSPAALSGSAWWTLVVRAVLAAVLDAGLVVAFLLTRHHPRTDSFLESGRSPVIALYSRGNNLGERGEWNFEKMNDPSLNQLDRTLAHTGDHDGCTNGYGVYDMVGNLHEWVADPAGTFQGGYYQDTHENGDGCSYKTMAHASWYHDYSTGFRCCADVAP